MNLELVQFETADKLNLPGLLYRPDQPSKRAAIYLHGIGSSVIYQVDRNNELATAFSQVGISYLSFNNRGSEMINQHIRAYKNNQRQSIKAGMTYELIKDCIKDIDGAVAFLKKRGFNELYLVGHSTGANKICVYNFYKPKNPIKKYVLLAGGDDTGLSYQALGAKKFTRALLKAESQVRMGKGEVISKDKLYGEDEIFSYQAAYDILNPDGDYNTFPFLEALGEAKLSTQPLFRHYKSITKPTLVVYGAQDEYCYGKVPECVGILKREAAVPKEFSYKIIEDADHSFHGQEKQMAKTIANWL